MKDIYYMDALTGEEGTITVSDSEWLLINEAPELYNMVLVSMVETPVTEPEPVSPTATIADVYKAIRRNNEVWLP